MNLEKHFLSISQELDALKDRVRNFIDDAHWLTDGQWKETVLRAAIGQRLPDNAKIGRGFVITEQRASTECDILIYRDDAPVLFRDGDLVFLTPDAIIGVIEVKSRLNTTSLREAVRKLCETSRLIGRGDTQAFFGLFAFEFEGQNPNFSTSLRGDEAAKLHPINLISLGPDLFVRWWDENPESGELNYRKWHVYRLPSMSAGYFISNVVDGASQGKASAMARFWYPAEGKETRRIEVIPEV